MSGSEDDKDKTPVEPFVRRQSTTLLLAPDWAKEARQLAHRLRAEQQDAQARGLIWRAVETQRKANDCIDFARAFEGWKIRDPGSAPRTALAREWSEHQRHCEEWLRGPLRGIKKG